MSNILLSLTSIRQRTYVWTTFVGTIPSNLPFAYAAQLGLSLANEFPPKDPVVLTMTIVGFIASALVAWKIGRIARRTLRKHGVDLGGRTDPTPAAMGAAAEELATIPAVRDAAADRAAARARRARARPRQARPARVGALSSCNPPGTPSCCADLGVVARRVGAGVRRGVEVPPPR